MKILKKVLAYTLAIALTVSSLTFLGMKEVKAESFTGSLSSVDKVTVDGNVANITFNSGALKGKITFLDDGIFRYNVDPSAKFEEYAKARNGYPDTAKIQAQPDNSDRYSHPNITLEQDTDKFVLKSGDTSIEFGKKTALMKVKKANKVLMQESSPLKFEGNNTTQTLVKHNNVNYNQALREEYFGGGTQNGRFVHTGKIIEIANKSSWNDGGVASPNPFYYTSNGYGILRNTYMNGVYDFGRTNQEAVTSTHQENEFDAYIFLSSSDNGSNVTKDLLNGYFKVTGNPALLPEYGFYLGHLNAYNRDAWSSTNNIGTKWTVKGNASYQSEGKSKYEAGGTGFKIKQNQQAETLNGYGPKVHKSNVPSGVTYPREFSARAVIDEHLEYDMPLGYFLPNDGYGAGYGQNGYNVTGGVESDGSSSAARLEAVAANVQNLKDFANYAKEKGIDTGLWTQSNLTPDSNPNTYWHLLRDFKAEVLAGVTTLKTDVAWVGYGYSFQLSGVKQAYDIVTKNKNTRPNIISLDGWAGSQRYNSVWSGDQSGGNWEYIRFHIPTFIGQSLSGNPNVGSDMDGIWGGHPIIATRDYQWKSFAPQMLDMDGWGTYMKAPYVHGDPYTGISRMYLKLKAKLMPYIYTNAYAASNIDTGNGDKGLPMVRAMFLEFPEEPYAYTQAGSKYQYMWGKNLLVAPLYSNYAADELGNDTRNGIYLPGGQDTIWIDYFTGKQYRGGNIVNGYSAPIWKLPLFVKNGAILPMYAEHNSAIPGTEKGVDKTKRLVEFWPNGNTNFTAIEDDGRFVENTLEKVKDYGTVSSINYGNHVSTKYTSTVDGTKATLVAEQSSGNYDGYNSNKNTTFIVNASKKPTSLEALNGSTTLQGVEVDSKEAFDNKTVESGKFVYFYDQSPKIETFASKEEVKLAELVKDVRSSGKLYVKFAQTDVNSNAQKLVVNGFENKGTLSPLKLNQSLQAPTLRENVEQKTPTSITLEWNKVEGATGYEILVDGKVAENGNITSGQLNTFTAKDLKFIHTQLAIKSEHHYRIRSINNDGYSRWSDEFTATSAEDPFRLTPKVSANNIKWTGDVYSSRNPIRAFDREFQSGDEGFHSGANAIGKTLTVDYRNAYVLDKIEYYPRTDAANGTVTKMKVETSLDGVNWVYHGDTGSSTTDDTLAFNMPRNAEIKLLNLTDPNTKEDHIGARYVRFTPLQSVGNFFSASEIKVYTIPEGYGSIEKPFRAGNITTVGVSEPTLTTFQQMFQKESSQHNSSKNATWVGEVQKLYGDINFNKISDIWDYAITAFAVDGGTKQTGKVGGDIVLQTDKTTVTSGEEFTINVSGSELKNLNAYGTIINYNPQKIEYLETKYVGTGDMYTQGMTGNIINEDNTAYINHNAVNMGNKELLNGSKLLAKIKLRAKENINLTDKTILDLSKVTLMGPDFSVKESKVVDRVEFPEVPSGTNSKYKQKDFTITMTNDVLTTDDGRNVNRLVQTETYESLFDGNYGRDFEFKWDMGNTILDKAQKLPTTMHFTLKSPSKISTINVHNAPNRGNGYLTSMSAEVSYEDGSKKEFNFDNESKVYAINPDDKNITKVDLTFKTSTGTANASNNPRENRMLTLSEIEFIHSQNVKPERIELKDTVRKEIYVNSTETIEAKIYPEELQNQYFTVESSNTDVAKVITLVDSQGVPSYKVMGLKEGQSEITLVSVADSTVKTKFTLKVKSGVDKTELAELLESTKVKDDSIYTSDSYAKFSKVYNEAKSVMDDKDATEDEVTSAVRKLKDAYSKLVVQPVDKSLLLKTPYIVETGSAKYSEENTYGNMFDKDLSTYWESPYMGEDARLPQEVVLTLKDDFRLQQVSATSHTIQNGGITDLEVLVSNDGKTWTQVSRVLTSEEAYKQEKNVTLNARFAPQTARFVKLVVNKAVGRIPEEDNMYGRIAELNLYGTTNADKSKLAKLVEQIDKLNSKDYLPETWDKLSKEYKKAKVVLDDNSVLSDEVDARYEELSKALNNLVRKPKPEVKKIKIKGYSLGVNIRNAEGKKLDVLQRGKYIEGIYNPSNPNWLRITYKGKPAFVYRKYIQKDQVRYEGYSAWVNYRDRVTGKVLGTIRYGVKLIGRLNGKNPNWIDMYIKGKKVKAHKNYVVQPTRKTYKTQTLLNFRSVPNGKKLGIIPRGLKLRGVVYGKKANWLYLRYNSMRGYVYIK